MKINLSRVNWLLEVCMFCLLAIGVAYINSASAMREGSVRMLYLRQLVRWIPAGFALHLFFTWASYRKLADRSLFFYFIILVFLVIVLIPGIGVERFGARRWVFGLQPSEFAKLFLIPALAFVLGGSSIQSGIKKLLLSLLMMGIPMALIIKQPDLGTALAMSAAIWVMMFVSGCAPRTLIAMVCVAIAAGTVFLAAIIGPELAKPRISEASYQAITSVTHKVLHKHWRERVETFVFPDRDPLGAGWNKRQSEIAVGSGGTWGKGYLNGTQNILGFLPRSVSSTDFIFSVIAEEAGFMGGSLLLLVLFTGLLGAVAWIGFGCIEPVGRLICAGVGSLLFVHVFVNMAMTIGLVPITGLPLPLISYGGSFTISTMAMLGIVQSVAVHGRGIPGGEA